MPFVPWAQQAQGARYGEEQVTGEEKPWWYQALAKAIGVEGKTLPSWQQMLGGKEAQLAFLGMPIGGWAGGLSGYAGAGTEMGAKAIPKLASEIQGAWNMAPSIGSMLKTGIGGALAPVPKWMAGHKLLTGAGMGASTVAGLSIPPLLRDQYGIGAPPPLPNWANYPMTSSLEAEGPEGTNRAAGFGAPTTSPTKLPTPSDLTQPAKPELIDLGGGIKIVYNPNSGEYSFLPQEPWWQLTTEEQKSEAAKNRQAPFDLATLTAGLGDQYNRQLTQEQQMALAAQGDVSAMERLKFQYGSVMEQVMAQIQADKELETQRAQLQRQNMYAADPYKYWAQMGTPTPEAVAALTGGKVQAGQPFQATPLSYPSAQWMQGLLPSEQQQISGGLNWMGVNPEDWYSMYQRMIPGLSARQVPQWSR